MNLTSPSGSKTKRWLQLGGPLWKVVALLMIFVPWYMRDRVAVELDMAAAAVQEVQGELHVQQQQQQADRDQLELVKMIYATMLTVEAMNGERQRSDVLAQKARLLDHTITSDMEALKTQAIQFGADVDQFAQDHLLEPAQQLKLKEIALKAITAADSVISVTQAKEPVNIDKLSQQALAAEAELTQALHDLDNSLEKMKRKKLVEAEGSRNLAWILSVIGTLMMGDWRKLLAPEGTEEGVEQGANA